MTFASTDYLLLLAVVLATYWCLPRRPQNVLLIVASLVFYGWVHPAYVLLLLYSATLDFSCGQGMARWPERKQLFLWASVLGNGALLGTFKYFDFFVHNVAALLTSVGLQPHLPVLGVLLPIGISFYTFQSLSYSVDVYRGKSPACRDPLAFLLFVSFFPQLVMGPISRARWMLPQVDADRTLTFAGVRTGVSLLLFGLFKKVVVADTISGFVHPMLAQDHPATPMVLAAGAGASVMMFADFSGYTDIARGTARLLGFELPRNFRAPYLATTPAGWWSRWHISFYQWMGEYVFQPLVLTRFCRRWLVIPFVKPTPTVHVARGVMLTMLLSGLWHGAGWHYIVWGGFFGCVQLAYFFVGRRLPPAVRDWRHGNWVLRPLMWSIVLFGELLFQVRDVGKLLGWLTQSPLATGDQWVATASVVVVTAMGAAPLVANWALVARWPGLVHDPRFLPVQTTLWCAQGWLVFLFYRGAASEFAYYQF